MKYAMHPASQQSLLHPGSWICSRARGCGLCRMQLGSTFTVWIHSNTNTIFGKWWPTFPWTFPALRLGSTFNHSIFCEIMTKFSMKPNQTVKVCIHSHARKLYNIILKLWQMFPETIPYTSMLNAFRIKS